MNSIEHSSDELDRRIRKRQPKGTTDLQKLLLEEWTGIGNDVTEKLVDSMPNRLHECIKQKGTSDSLLIYLNYSFVMKR